MSVVKQRVLRNVHKLLMLARRPTFFEEHVHVNIVRPSLVPRLFPVFQCYTLLVPRLFPVFQCYTLKNGRAWELKSREQRHK